jgi:hypothetical protein
VARTEGTRLKGPNDLEPECKVAEGLDWPAQRQPTRGVSHLEGASTGPALGPFLEPWGSIVATLLVVVVVVVKVVVVVLAVVAVAVVVAGAVAFFFWGVHFQSRTTSSKPQGPRPQACWPSRMGTPMVSCDMFKLNGISTSHLPQYSSP